MTLPITLRDGATTFAVYVKPRASSTRVLGVRGDALEVALTAPPVDGEANAELLRALARHFGVRRADVEIVAGDRSRRKVVLLRGLSAEEVLRRALGSGSEHT